METHQSDRRADRHTDLFQPRLDERGATGGLSNDDAVQFRRFRVVRGARLLLRDGQPVHLGGRAFDLLLLLLERRGTVVTKGEIVDHVWPSTLVEESNLRFQMGCLRRALGEDRDLIKTIQGRGYLFVDEPEQPGPADIARPGGHTAPVLPAMSPTSRHPRLSASEDAMVAAGTGNDRPASAADELLRSAGLIIDLLDAVEALLTKGPSPPAPHFLHNVWKPNVGIAGVSRGYLPGGLRGVRRPHQYQFRFESVRSDYAASPVDSAAKSVPSRDVLKAIRFVVASLATRTTSTN